MLSREDERVRLNGGAQITTLDGHSQIWTTVATGAGKLNELLWDFAGNGGACTCFGIKVDGKILTNPFIYSADL